jgi:DNA-binding NtrC family response regulator
MVRFGTDRCTGLSAAASRAHIATMESHGLLLPDTSSHLRCLVVEDQALIGMELEACLEEVGIQVAGPFSSCERVLAWVQKDTPNVALLDFKLKDGFCTEVVRALRQRGVPVVIYSGYSQPADMPEDLRDVIWIEKPVARATLLDVLVSVVPTKAGRAAA